MRNTYGSKRFVMAIMETGISWATSSSAAEHSADTDIPTGAPEDTITRFINWILKVVKTIDNHKNDPTVQEQRRRSGEKKHSSGLREDKKKLKAARTQARSNFSYGAELNRRLELYEGKGKGKGKGKRDHLLWPVAWHELSRNEQWFVRELRNGSLKKAKEVAEEKHHPRSGDTNRFRVD